MMEKPRKVTMQEIADRIGVSKYAVSKALSGKPGISASTREKIFEVASQLGYLDQKLDKRLQLPKQNGEDPDKFVGILFPNIRSQNRESGYWGKVLDGVFKGLEVFGTTSVMITDDEPRNFHKIMRPEGLVGIIGVGLIKPSMLVELRNLNIPFVLVDHEDDLVSADTIFMNNYDLVRKQVLYLIGKGHVHIQFVGDWRYARSFSDRWSGFKSALVEKEMTYIADEQLLSIQPTADLDNLQLVKQCIGRLYETNFPTAFVCANDRIAALCLRAMAELNIKVPADASVVGFDNDPELIEEFPELSSVNAEKEALGSQAVDLLFRRVANANMPYEKILLQSELLIRGSIASPRQHSTIHT